MHAPVAASSAVFSEPAGFSVPPRLGADHLAPAPDTFDLAWEAEVESAPPEHDATLSEASAEIERALAAHAFVDAAAGWEDFAIDLPERSASLHALDDAERRADLRSLLLRAIREGSVPRMRVEDLTRSDGQAPDPEAEQQLRRVLNDLGADTDERFEYSAASETFEVPAPDAATEDEEELIDAALAHLDALASTAREPLRQYSREAQKFALLTAADEVALARRMERGKSMIVEAACRLPGAVALILELAEPVRSGAQATSVVERIASLSESADASDGEFHIEDGDPAEDRDAADVQTEKLAKLRDDFLTRMDKLAAMSADLRGLNSDERGRALAAMIESAIAETLRPVIFKAGVLESVCQAVRFADADAASGISEAALADMRRRVAEGESTWRMARQDMAQANLRLVASIAKRYMRSGIPLDDLIQEGNIGLLKAVDKFDWRRGFKFATIATWWIRQQVSRSVGDDSRLIRVPVHAHESIQKMEREAEAFELAHGSPASVEHLASVAEMTEERARALLDISRQPLPIHDLDPSGETPDRWYADEDADPDDALAQGQLRRRMDLALADLKAKDAQIIRMRFGLAGRGELTLDEVGKRFEVTRERIRQIESKALRSLKVRAIKAGMRGWFGEPEKASEQAEGSRVEEVDEEAGLAEAIERRTNSVSDVIAEAERLGYAVELASESKGGLLWILGPTPSSGADAAFSRRLSSLGFKEWPGKGFWK